MSYGTVCPHCGMYATAGDPTWRCRCPKPEPSAPLPGILDSQTHESKTRIRSIVLEIWPAIASAREGARRMGEVEDVLARKGTPNLSQKDRDAIEAAAKRIPEEP